MNPGKVCVVFSVILLKQVKAQTLADWQDRYDTLWGSGTCNGVNQSPIDLPTTLAVTGVTVTFNYYDVYIEFSYRNDGITGQADVANTGGEAIPTISGGGLDGEYRLAYFHSRWGTSNSDGSEHSIGGRKYNLEIQFVHYKDDYATLHDAIDSGAMDSLAVVAVLFQAVSGNPGNDMLDLVSSRSTLVHAFNSSTVFVINPGLLIGSNPGPVFLYDGSLTSPQCSEVVKWIVFENPQRVSTFQLSRFKTLEPEGNPSLRINHNWRPTQSSNGRTITKAQSFNQATNIAPAPPSYPANNPPSYPPNYPPNNPPPNPPNTNPNPGPDSNSGTTDGDDSGLETYQIVSLLIGGTVYLCILIYITGCILINGCRQTRFSDLF